MEGTKTTTMTPPASAPVVSSASVFGSDILLRLDFPTCLVRAAAVSKRWLRQASDPAFLDRFRARHPPRLLGFYLTTSSFSRLEFVPAPHDLPTELAAVLRRGDDFNLPLDDEQRSSLRGVNGMYCHNGRLFFGLYDGAKFTYGVYMPLHPERGIFIVPNPPMASRHDVVVRDVFAREESGGELSFFWFGFECSKKGKATAYLYMLQDYAWRMQTSARTKIPGWPESGQKLRSFLAIDDCVYLVVTTSYILVFHWTSSSFSTIKFPEGVDGGATLLSKASDSGLYLVHLMGLKLSIWRRMTDNGSVADWMLFDTIWLHDMCANLRMPEDGCTSLVALKAEGDNAEFVFLEIDTCVFYLDVRSKALHKCYEVTDGNPGWVRPFRMIWPPVFPVLKE